MWYHFDLDAVCNDCYVGFDGDGDGVDVAQPKVCHSMDGYWSVYVVR